MQKENENSRYLNQISNVVESIVTENTANQTPEEEEVGCSETYVFEEGSNPTISNENQSNNKNSFNNDKEIISKLFSMVHEKDLEIYRLHEIIDERNREIIELSKRK